VLWGGRLKPGETVTVPDARHAHVFVAAGRVVMEGAESVELTAGDAVRLTEAGAPRLVVDDSPAGAEVLIWEMGGTV
jgi:redox-sensitive bicupin YhaK (pirin superfamily)